MTHLYIENIKEKSPKEIKKEALSQRLLDYETNKDYINRIFQKKHPQAQKESLCALILLDFALQSSYGIQEKLIISKTEIDKPYFKNSDVKFSISHSEDYVAVAVSDNEIGVDIEKITDKSRDNMIDRFFIPSEQEFYYNSEDKAAAFAVLWTRKEAYLKYTSKGITEGLSGYDVTKSTELFHEFSHDGYQICLYSKEKPSITII